MPTPTSTPTQAADLIFSDGFESGDLSGWSGYADDSGDLAVDESAAMQGSYGLKAVLDDNTAIYTIDDTPTAETHYRARFYFDPNSTSMGSNNAHFIFVAYSGASTENVRLNFKYSSGYQIQGIVRTDSSDTGTGFYSLSDGPHAIEIDWQAASGAGANDGSFTLGSASKTVDPLSNTYTNKPNVLTENRYKPWGETRYTSGALSTDNTFTGQKSEMQELGLLFYNARWLDPALGRFIQADSIVPEPGNPLAWDRYAYVMNAAHALHRSERASVM